MEFDTLMSNLGGFSEEALQLYQLVASEKGYDFSEGEETYDFTRCMRPNGTYYGTRGKCKSGSEAGVKEQPDAKPKTKATRATSDGVKTSTRKPRATASELKASQRKLYDDAKTKRAAAKEAEKAAKLLERETKGDKSPAARKRRLEANRAWDRAATAADRAQRAWEREHERWSKAGNREERAKMSPAQRAEARRMDKTIKELG